MDKSATPWRVLDDAGAGPRVAKVGSDDTAASPSALPRIPWTVIAGFGVAAALALGAFAIAASTPRGEITIDGGTSWAASGSPQESGGPPSNGAALLVDVQGAVIHPGLQEVESGSRVGDAIAAAGGYGPRVDAERAGRELNLAATLKDGDRIVVPSRDDPQGATGSGTSDSGTAGSPGGPSGGLVDLNSATAAQLDELPGVGPVTAQKIIDARSEKPFASIDELRERKVVGSSVLDKLRDLVTVR
jgi:competence protein ComEA